MKLQVLFPILALILSMLACNLPSNAPVTETPTLSLSTSTATLSLPTSAPTQTPLPTNTSPPPPTSTPSVPVAFPRDVNVNCRLGPGTAWVAISALTVGQNAQITGKNSDGSWWSITDPLNSGRNCWVSAGVVGTGGNLAAIPVVGLPTASVTNVTVSVDPRTISAPGCLGPILPLEINGTIETNGPTEVRWRFETQQGGAMPNQTTTFDAFGEREFSVDYTPPITAGTYWVRLIVSGPNNIQAETSYTITCP
ncbi:MAG TPA: hypothetical protein VJ785_17005 [Anaerolineales bacterium]|nr:hypothetical protein [Anaerolineales bacterium]